MPPHCALLAVDTEAYASRPGPALPRTHRAIRETLDEALARAGFEADSDVTRLDDTGDGAIVTVAGQDLSRLLDPVVSELDRELRRRVARGEQRLRMRVAIHAGPVDDTEHVGPAKNETARLLSATSVYEALRRNTKADIALIVSDYVYQAAVRQDYAAALDSDWFTPVDVTEKEYEARAWVYVPGAGRPELGEPASEESGSAVGEAGKAGKRSAPAREDQRGAGGVGLPAVSGDRAGNVFSHHGTGNQFAGDVDGDLNITQTHAGRDVVSGHRGDVHGDVVHRDKRSGESSGPSFGDSFRDTDRRLLGRDEPGRDEAGNERETRGEP